MAKFISPNYTKAAASSGSPDTMSIVDVKAGEEGLHMTALRPIASGTRIMESRAISIALEPPYRTTCCGFCCSSDRNYHTSVARLDNVKEKAAKQRGSGMELCTDCNVISFCSSCSKSRFCRSIHQRECRALQTVAAVWNGLGNVDEGDDGDKLTPSHGQELDSCHLLTTRILVLRKAPKMSNDDKRSDLNDADNDLHENLALLDTLYECEQLPLQFEEFVECLFKKNSKVDSVFNDTLDLQNKSNLKADYLRILRQVIGCGHAITNISLPLGQQCLGRALFVSHSFYNHSCSPNAYLSCHIAQRVKDETKSSNASSGALIARVHALRDVGVGDSVTLSYIPLCGMAKSERQKRLLSGYNFVCKCELCQAGKGDILLPLEDGIVVDADPIREIQYTCSERLLQSKDANQSQEHEQLDRSKDSEDGRNGLDVEQIAHVLSLIKMTQRGIRNQQIPVAHEVSLESHRLLALGYSMLHDYSQAISHHMDFVRIIEDNFHGLLSFDPVALANQYMEFSQDLLLDCETISDKNESHDSVTEADNESRRKKSMRNRTVALRYLTTAVGTDHPWVLSLAESGDNSNDKPRKRKCFEVASSQH